MATIWALFLEKGHEISPPLPSSYTPVAISSCRLLLVTIFLTIMKLKTDVFSVSTIFL